MTKEFVTLPREVVEQALKVLEYAANDVLTGRNAATALRAALEQPHTTEQSYMGCVTSDMHELAEWLNTMYEDSKEQIAALEQHQQESSCDNDLPRETGQLITSSSIAAPAGWKLVPVEPTDDMFFDPDYVCVNAAETPDAAFQRIYKNLLAAAPQPPVVEQSDGDTVPVPRSLLGATCAAINRKQDAPKLLEQLRRYTTGDLSTPALEQPQVEQEPVAWLHQCNKRPDLIEMSFSKREPTLASKGYKARPLIFGDIAHPQPKREPLTDKQIDELIEEGIFGGNPYELVRRLEEERGVFMTRPLTVEQIDGIIADLAPVFLDTPTGFEEDFCRAIEAAHNIK